MKNSLKRECLRHLRQTFGLDDYRPGQKEAVHALLSGRDVLCILPTGAGKSLCWQLPAVVNRGLTIVVSPLIALMRDQVQHLHAIGIPAISMDSLMSPEEKEFAAEKIRTGAVRIVFVSPERLEQPRFRLLCRQAAPWLVVVDEAHCVVQWGEKFRPAYTGIAEFVCNLPKRPVLCALTATADEPMQRAIRNELGITRAKKVLLPIIRENLVYEIRTTLDKSGDVLRMCREVPCKTVIFCRSRARTEQLAGWLSTCGLSAECYHAGLGRDDRIAVQQRFMDGMLQILCATSAFGLGVDIPDIRRVIHDELPDDVIDYVQQSGRAGRDGERAECLLLLSPNDLVRKAAFRSYAGNPLRRLWDKYCHVRKTDRLVRLVMTAKCIPAAIAGSFGKSVSHCGRCSACRKGRMVRYVPSYAYRKEKDIRLWLLQWQRDALASKRRCLPGQIVPDSALSTAAEKFVFPEGISAPDELERMLGHFRHESVHNPVDEWIS